MMKFKSLYPPVCIWGPFTESWYIIVDGKWNPVTRFYSWAELEPMWEKIQQTKSEAKSQKLGVKETYKVKGSKGNVYNVVNDDGFWTCTCPAHSFGRGRDCKHITQLKSK